MKRTRIKVGDVLIIPLSNGQKAYGQYVFKDKKMGPLIQICDLITDNEVEIDQLKTAKPLFPPIITGIFAAVRMGLWEVIGHMKVDKFVYPNFISAHYNEKTGIAHAWFLWDGEKSISLGPKLPKKYKHLEFLEVWSPYDVVHRIETGENPDWPFRD